MATSGLLTEYRYLYGRDPDPNTGEDELRRLLGYAPQTAAPAPIDTARLSQLSQSALGPAVQDAAASLDTRGQQNLAKVLTGPGVTTISTGGQFYNTQGQQISPEQANRQSQSLYDPVLQRNLGHDEIVSQQSGGRRAISRQAFADGRTVITYSDGTKETIQGQPAQAPKPLALPEGGPLGAGGQPSAGGGAAAGGAVSAPRPGTFTPQPFRSRLDQPIDLNQLRQVANIIAEEQYAPYRRQVMDALAQMEQQGNQRAAALRRELEMVEERNRTRLASQGLLDSGYLAGANRGAQVEFAQQIGDISERQRLAQQQAQGQLIDLERLRGLTAARAFEQLRREERQFGLEEARQHLAEYLGVNQLQLQAMDQNFQQQLAAARFNEDVRQFGLQYALEQARLGGDLAYQAALTEAQRFGIERGRALLPGELMGQNLLNIGRLQEIGQGAARFQLEQEAMRLENQITQLELELARDPDVGRRAQLQAEMQAAQARLRQIDADLALSGRRLDLEEQSLGLREREIGLREQELLTGGQGGDLPGLAPAEQSFLVNIGIRDMGNTINPRAFLAEVQNVTEALSAGQTPLSIIRILGEDRSELERLGVDVGVLIDWVDSMMPSGAPPRAR